MTAKKVSAKPEKKLNQKSKAAEKEEAKPDDAKLVAEAVKKFVDTVTKFGGGSVTTAQGTVEIPAAPTNGEAWN